jgi:peptidoglycan/LPS O-acetylase OafA/YrhL
MTLERKPTLAVSPQATELSPGESPPTSAKSARTSAPRQQRRIPSLDGLRAVSILLVIGWHLSSSGSASWLQPLWRIDSGNLGVRVFFVISGYLITSLLLAEHARTGTINLRRFYLRRAFRIMPAFYVFLAIIAVAAHGLVEASPASILRAATYTADYTQTQWAVGHTWSLAVEEQFYLLWPGLIVFLGLRRSFVGAALVLLLSPTVRAIAIGGHWPTNPRYAFEGVADALATGCLLAYARPWLWDRAPYRRMLSSRAMTAWPAVVAVIAMLNVRSAVFGAVAGISLLNIAIAVLIDWCLRFPNSLVGRVLNARPIAFVGVLSYSLYLWQQPFLRPGHTLPLPWSLLCIAALALLSYYAVEQPFLRLRARIEATRRAPASTEASASSSVR